MQPIWWCSPPPGARESRAPPSAGASDPGATVRVGHLLTLFLLRSYVPQRGRLLLFTYCLPIVHFSLSRDTFDALNQRFVRVRNRHRDQRQISSGTAAPSRDTPPSLAPHDGDGTLNPFRHGRRTLLAVLSAAFERRGPPKTRLGAAFFAAIAMGTLLALALVLPGQANHGAGMEALAIDMDVAGNSATALGPRQDCLTLAPGGDALVDVTATNIPPANSMSGFAYKLQYPSAAFTITSQDPNYLLAANADSLLADTSDPLPDEDLNDDWNSTVTDTGSGLPESGSPL